MIEMEKGDKLAKKKKEKNTEARNSGAENNSVSGALQERRRLHQQLDAAISGEEE